MQSVSKDNLLKRSVQGLAWEYLNVFTLAFLQLGVTTILARLLSPEDYGLLGIALIFSGIVTLLSQFGVGPAIIQRQVLSSEVVRTSFTLAMMFGLVITLITWFASPLIAEYFRAPMVRDILRAISLSFIVASFGTVSEALLTRELRFRKQMWIDVTSYFLGYGVTGIVLAFQGYQVWALVGAILAQNFIKAVLMFISVRHSIIPLIGKNEVKEILRYGSGITLATVFNYFATQADYFVVGRVLGTVLLGIYSRSYHLMMLPATYIGQAIQKVSFPAMSKMQNELERLLKAYFMSATVIGLVMMPLSAYFFIAAPEIVSLILGPKWLEVIPPFRILSMGIFFRTAYKIDHSLTRALGAVYRRSVVDGIYAGLIFVASLIGVQWGIVGVSLGVLGVIVSAYILSASLSLRLLNSSWRNMLKVYSGGSILLLIVILSAWPVRSLLMSSQLPDWVIFGGTSLVSVGAVLLFVFWKPHLVGQYGILALEKVISTVPVRFVRCSLEKLFRLS